MKNKLTKEDYEFNRGTATWKGKMLMDMSREELYKALEELNKLYQDSLKIL